MKEISETLIILSLLFLVFCFSQSGNTKNANAVTDLSLINQSTVRVICNTKLINLRQPWVYSDFSYQTGSGFIIEHNNKKYIISNAHVVKDAVSIRVRKVGSDNEYNAKVEYFSGPRDLALISPLDDAFFEGTEPMTLKENVNIGDSVSSFGFPIGGNTITMTDGVISRIDFGSYSQFGFDNLRFQVDAALNFGTSGGPAINNNAVIGVNFLGMQQGQNIGYIIPSSVVNQFLTDIDNTPHEPPHVSDVPFISIKAIPLQNPQLRKVLSLNANETGILVTEISGIEKEKGLLQVDDVILSINEHPIGNQGNINRYSNDNISWRALISEKQIGETVSLKLKRGGEIITITYPLTHNFSESLITPGYRFLEDIDYVLLGGIVFVELNQTVLELYKLHDQPHISKYINCFRSSQSNNGEKIVIITNILYHPINIFYEPELYEMTTVSTFNNEKIKSLAHFKGLIQQSQNTGGNLMIKGSTLRKTPISIGFSWEDLNLAKKEFIFQYGARQNVF